MWLRGDTAQDRSGNSDGTFQTTAASGCSEDVCSGVVGAVDNSASGDRRCSLTRGDCDEAMDEKEAVRLRRLLPCDSWW